MSRGTPPERLSFELASRLVAAGAELPPAAVTR
jgi:hypothetical protein